MAEFYSAGSGTIPPLPWQTFPPPFSLEFCGFGVRHGRQELSARIAVGQAEGPEVSQSTGQARRREKTPEETDEITHVIVNLFDKLIGPVVSQMGDLAIGVFAGSAASGTTVGFGMAGGLGMAGPPAAFATGVATAVPIGAAIGLAATVAAEMLSNRLEESLNRGEFEEGLRQTVDATENAIETGMIAVLHEHVEAWYADIVNRLPSNKPWQTTFRKMFLNQ